MNKEERERRREAAGKFLSNLAKGDTPNIRGLGKKPYNNVLEFVAGVYSWIRKSDRNRDPAETPYLRDPQTWMNFSNNRHKERLGRKQANQRWLKSLDLPAGSFTLY